MYHGAFLTIQDRSRKGRIFLQHFSIFQKGKLTLQSLGLAFFQGSVLKFLQVRQFAESVFLRLGDLPFHILQVFFKFLYRLVLCLIFLEEGSVSAIAVNHIQLPEPVCKKDIVSLPVNVQKAGSLLFHFGSAYRAVIHKKAGTHSARNNPAQNLLLPLSFKDSLNHTASALVAENRLVCLASR